jgi:DWNN domain
MSSTILYKFRSGTTFEALSLPGNNVRLLDVKKAIVTTKKLDQGSMDFDLSVKDATSGVEYMDDSAILPRGTRIVVQRLPSARGQGILAKIARSQYGDTSFAAASAPAPSGPGADFYTIDSRDREDDEEFVSSSVVSHPLPSTEESELAALRAATDSSMSTGPKLGVSLRSGPGGGGGFRPNQPAGLGPPPSRGLANFQPSRSNVRPNADPELRELEQQPQKKRATGIPRTFLSISAPMAADGTEGGTIGIPLIQPNTIGFEELLSRGGGQSENSAGTKRDLDYAIKLTATTIPEYLQCAICHSVVRDAMMLPWDPEGRTTCEQCIRTALTENGFRCPLTQQEGVSPDDLLPNHALRKAAAQFVSDVMEKIKEIEEQAEIEEEINVEGDQQKFLEGDLNDKGVVLTRRATASEKRKKQDDEFFGGGDDDFGGDVFAVEAEKPADEGLEDTVATENEIAATKSKENMDEESTPSTVKAVEKQPEAPSNDMMAVARKPEKPELSSSPSDQVPKAEKVPTPQDSKDNGAPRRDFNRRRGPPAGYAMGPAGGAVDKQSSDHRGPWEMDRGRRRGEVPPNFNGGRDFRGRSDSMGGGDRDVDFPENHSHPDVRMILGRRGSFKVVSLDILIFHDLYSNVIVVLTLLFSSTVP